MHERKKCQHGYILSQCRCIGERKDIIVPCEDVPKCPVTPVAEDEKRYPVRLTRDEMRLIRAAMASMGTLPIATSVRKAMDDGETAATIARAVVRDTYGDILTVGALPRTSGPGDTSKHIPN